MAHIIRENRKAFHPLDVDDSFADGFRYIIRCGDGYSYNFKVVDGQIDRYYSKYLTDDPNQIVELVQIENDVMHGFSMFCSYGSKQKINSDLFIRNRIPYGKRTRTQKENDDMIKYSRYGNNSGLTTISMKNIRRRQNGYTPDYLRKKIVLTKKIMTFINFKHGVPHGLEICIHSTLERNKSSRIRYIKFNRTTQLSIGTMITHGSDTTPHNNRTLMFSSNKYSNFRKKRFLLSIKLDYERITGKKGVFLPSELVYEIIKKIDLIDLSWNVLQYVDMGPGYDVEIVNNPRRGVSDVHVTRVLDFA